MPEHPLRLTEEQTYIIEKSLAFTLAHVQSPDAASCSVGMPIDKADIRQLESLRHQFSLLTSRKPSAEKRFQHLLDTIDVDTRAQLNQINFLQMHKLMKLAEAVGVDELNLHIMSPLEMRLAIAEYVVAHKEESIALLAEAQV